MNNKGQTLVMFMLLLPIVMMLLGLIVDVGLLFIEKRKIDNNIKEAIEYRFNTNKSDNEMYSDINNLLTKNIDDIKTKDINISNDYIEITINKDFRSVFSLLFDRTIYEIQTTYVGYISNDKLVIEKE